MIGKWRNVGPASVYSSDIVSYISAYRATPAGKSRVLFTSKSVSAFRSAFPAAVTELSTPSPRQASLYDVHALRFPCQFRRKS